MRSLNNEAKERAFDRVYREEVRAKWDGLLVRLNGTDRVGRVINAWPKADGSVGLCLHVGAGEAHVHSTNEYWTPARRRDVESG